MITFTYLNKNEKEYFLPKLFDLLNDNMHEIAPTELPYEQEKKQWLDNVSPALDKPARQIIMCFDDKELIGYIQYYINDKQLMIEELQLKKEYHCTLTFYRFCKHFIDTLPADIEYVEAFADNRNIKSQKLMQKLEMQLIDTISDFVHLRGYAKIVKKHFYS
ncbi:MAG: GNAT family N-acetyltransferase [Oscillospiraceae bacterium]|nr:GNAT family N-acetyltransferase [Oscillospiraceae bacterium]